MFPLNEPLPPPTLKTCQEWFGKTLSSPLGFPFTEELLHFIKPSPTLTAHHCMEIYCQQYWLRLLKTLHSNFPFLTRLFGYQDFNNLIGIPYLKACPPSHWALCCLGETLPEWIEAHYLENDSELVITAARIDWACGKTFWTPSFPPFDFGTVSLQEVLNVKLFLQPYISLFCLQGNFFSFRTLFLKEEVDFWSHSPFPELEAGLYCFIVYRTADAVGCWRPISFAEYRMLSLFTEGLTINEACAKMEEENEQIYNETKSFLPFWLRGWITSEWLIQIIN